jgi:hypothetical protein
MILKVADIQNDWFVFSGSHVVHVPSRFTGVVLGIARPAVAQATPRAARKSARKK